MSHVVIVLAWFLTVWQPDGKALLDGPHWSPAECETQKRWWQEQGRKVSDCERMQVGR